ncbi:MAG: hypothetical protein EON93_02535 [Burkholderiales bacterium]|nr:MAG: hypothetical protein EON93_02535 [Burkholderiales bacterium]
MSITAPVDVSVRLARLERRLAAHDMAIDILAEYIRADWPRMNFPRSFEAAVKEMAVPNPRATDPEAIEIAVRLLIDRLSTNSVELD